MKTVADTHTHTISSGHAFSTINENIIEASKKGLELIAITDHCPAIPGGPNEIYFSNSIGIPRELYGVKVLIGVEVDILDYEGNLGLSERLLKKQEFVIASMHDVVMEPGTIGQNTKAVINAIKNPLVDAVGHPDRPKFAINFEEVVLAAKKYNKLIEINSLSFKLKKEIIDNTTVIAKLCKKHEVKICTGSDAHFCTNVGEFDKSIELLNSIEFPEELIVSTSKEKLLNYLREQGKNL